jgi:hypothetical protein
VFVAVGVLVDVRVTVAVFVDVLVAAGVLVDVLVTVAVLVDVLVVVGVFALVAVAVGTARALTDTPRSWPAPPPPSRLSVRMWKDEPLILETPFPIPQ